MTKSTSTRIIITAVFATAIIITSAFYRFSPNAIVDDLQRNRHKIERMKILLVNQNPRDSGKWVELRCKGYQDYNSNSVWWSGMALVQPGRKFNLTLPTISETDLITVYCKYQGSDGCMANKVKIFESPGTDNYYCGESNGRCAYAFKHNGLVEKEYIGALNRTLGYVPMPVENGGKKCVWIDCILSRADRTIGENTCCGDKCASW